ncbi:MAG: tripartite tricarboxylate transporter TctB family protein [Candidatus Competibacteraceae bacterium]|jgi:hypothetical protein|nr:tripartite tricarboxylate transporter TctB family protein [Candidatus Competibacteraceae bacterium]
MKMLLHGVSGLLIAGIGALFLFGALTFELGTLQNIGPGMLPVALSGVTIVLGLLIAATDIIKAAAIPSAFDFRSLGLVAGAVMVYAFFIETGGIFLTTLAATFLLALARPRIRVLETLLLGLGLAIFVWAVFAKGLGMPLYFGPEFIR